MAWWKHGTHIPPSLLEVYPSSFWAVSPVQGDIFHINEIETFVLSVSSSWYCFASSSTGNQCEEGRMDSSVSGQPNGKCLYAIDGAETVLFLDHVLVVKDIFEEKELNFASGNTTWVLNYQTHISCSCLIWCFKTLGSLDLKHTVKSTSIKSITWSQICSWAFITLTKGKKVLQ